MGKRKGKSETQGAIKVVLDLASQGSLTEDHVGNDPDLIAEMDKQDRSISRVERLLKWATSKGLSRNLAQGYVKQLEEAAARSRGHGFRLFYSNVAQNLKSLVVEGDQLFWDWLDENLEHSRKNRRRGGPVIGDVGMGILKQMQSGECLTLL